MTEEGGTRAGARDRPVALLFVAAVILTSAPARDARAEIAGTYKVSGTSVKVKVKSWGEDCGTRPRSSSARGGKTVEVSRAGAHLLVGGQRTDRCWSRNPKVQRTKASATAGRWQVVCQTPTEDPRFEHGEYTLELLGDDTLRFTEQSRYDWRIEGDHCEAIIHLTRTYTRIEDEGAEDPSPGSDRPPADRDRCREPGEPVRLEVRPQHAQVAPGERICLRAVGRDGEGCRVPMKAAWERAAAGPPGRLGGSDGCFAAGEELGRVDVTATSGSLTATAVVEVRHPDIGELVAASLAEGGEDLAPLAEGGSPQARPGAVQGLGGASAEEPDEGSGLPWVVLAVGAAAAILLAIIAAVILRRGRRRREELVAESGAAAPKVVASAKPPPTAAETRTCPTCHREFDGETFYCPHDATELVAVSESEGAAGRGENRICPKCRRGFPSSTKVCPKDGEELVAYSVWRATQLRQRSEGETGGAMICPKCASRYEQDVQYCQKDGAKLVRIN